MKLLDELLRPSPLVVIDGGARNGFTDLPGLVRHAAVFCFEPSPEEVSRLANVESTLSRAEVAPNTVVSYPYALCASSGTAQLNISRRPGATSTLWPNPEVRQHFAPDNWSELVDIERSETVPAISMADFVKTAGLTHCDFLKLDTQGNEYDILQSAGAFLGQVGVIKAEVEFFPIYAQQKMFHHVNELLEANGFELVDIAWTEPCRRFHARPDLPPAAYRLIWADAIFVRRPYDFDDERTLHKALVLANLGYADLAIYMFRHVPTLTAEQRSVLEAYAVGLVQPKSWKGKLKRAIETRLGLRIFRHDWSGKQVRSAPRAPAPR